MKISYLLRGFSYTGGSMVLYSFMDRLCERGHTVYVITPDESVPWQPGFSQHIINRFRKESTWDAAKRLIKRYLPVQLLKPAVTLPPILALSRMNERLVRNWVESQVTIATYCTTAFASYALSERTTSLYHMQGWEEGFFEDEFHRKMAFLTYFLPIGLIGNSTALRETVRRRVGRDSWLLLPGVDTQLFYPRINISEKFGKTRKLRIVSYYSGHSLKGWPDGLEAMRKVFSKVGKDHVEWVVFGGRPPIAPDVPAKFVGRVFGEHLAELYSSADIVFMSSLRESFPLPPIEAMASGAAVVTTRPGTEDYAFDGINALVRPAKAPGQLAEAILELVENPSGARDLAQAGVQTARNLTWDKATDNLEAIFKAVAGAPEAFQHACTVHGSLACTEPGASYD